MLISTYLINVMSVFYVIRFSKKHITTKSYNRDAPSGRYALISVAEDFPEKLRADMPRHTM